MSLTDYNGRGIKEKKNVHIFFYPNTRRILISHKHSMICYWLVRSFSMYFNLP